MRDQREQRVGAVLLVGQLLGERIEFGIGGLVYEEAGNVRGHLELFSLVGCKLKVEQMALLAEMIRRRVPRG